MAQPEPPGDQPVPERIAGALAHYRRRIDALDEQLVRLLNERATCADEIGRLKEQVGLEIYQPGRERAVLEHVRRVNAGPLSDVALIRLFERIIDESRRLERLKDEGGPKKSGGSPAND